MADSDLQKVSIDDIDALVTGATPQFSLQIRERVSALTRNVPAGSDVRAYADTQLALLDALALGTTRGLSTVGTPPASDVGWKSIPSHPQGSPLPHAR